MGHSWPLFLYFRLFNPVDSDLMSQIFANDWIRTADLCCKNQPLNQLSHNHCPISFCNFIWERLRSGNLRAVIRMSAKEHRLTPVVSKTVISKAQNVSAFGIVWSNTRLKILARGNRQFFLAGNFKFFKSDKTRSVTNPCSESKNESRRLFKSV